MYNNEYYKMKKYDEILSATQKGPFLRMIQKGMTTNDIKEAVIESLDPYFENKKILEKYAINYLAVESINLLKLKNDNCFFEKFEECLSTYRSAKIKDPNACFKSCTLWQNEIEKSVSEILSLFKLEIDKNTLENEEFLLECLRNIGGMIEGAMKPYLKIFLLQVRIANDKKINPDKIKLSNLGKIVDELINESKCPNLFMVAPTKIRLNQWRNIAYHHSARIEKDEIVCWYGVGSNLKYFRFSRNDFMQIVGDISKILNVLKLTHTLFFIDNFDEIIKFSPTYQVREETEFLNFVIGLNCQGYEIVKFEQNKDKAVLIIRDSLKLPSHQRLSHVSQFIYLLWILTRSNQLIIEYHDNNNTPSFRLNSNSDLCEKVYKGEMNELILPRTMEIIDLKKIKTIR